MYSNKDQLIHAVGVHIPKTVLFALGPLTLHKPLEPLTWEQKTIYIYGRRTIQFSAEKVLRCTKLKMYQNGKKLVFWIKRPVIFRRVVCLGPSWIFMLMSFNKYSVLHFHILSWCSHLHTYIATPQSTCTIQKLILTGNWCSFLALNCMTSNIQKGCVLEFQLDFYVNIFLSFKKYSMLHFHNITTMQPFM